MTTVQKVHRRGRRVGAKQRAGVGGGGTAGTLTGHVNAGGHSQIATNLEP